MARVVSGGQTGVDRAALEAARATGTAYSGWCPRGGLAEDHPEPPGVLLDWPGLHETPSADPAERTVRNVRDSDAVLVLVLDPAVSSPGTELTLAEARRLGKPALRAGAGEVDRVAAWLSGLADRSGSWLGTGLGTGLVLDVAGPRETEDPGVQAAARDTLVALLRLGTGG